jgi:hypothetical protein
LICDIGFSILGEEERPMTLFDASLNVLQHSLGPSPNAPIKGGLAIVAEELNTTRPVLDVTLCGVELSDNIQPKVFLAFLGMEGRISNVVTQCMKNAKQVVG